MAQLPNVTSSGLKKRLGGPVRLGNRAQPQRCKAEDSCQQSKGILRDILMRVRALLPDGDERLTGSWRDERMRDSENSTYKAEQGSAGHITFLRRRKNTCPGNAPVQLSLATGLVQGGERGHCKGSREWPVSRETMHRSSREDRHH